MRFYLDDLRIGQRFVSPSHTIDGGDIVQIFVAEIVVPRRGARITGQGLAAS
jgi:hypothetical protein